MTPTSEPDRADFSTLFHAMRYREPDSSAVLSSNQHQSMPEAEKKYLLQLEAVAKRGNAELLRAVYEAPRLTAYMATLPAPQPPRHPARWRALLVVVVGRPSAECESAQGHSVTMEAVADVHSHRPERTLTRGAQVERTVQGTRRELGEDTE